MFVTELGHCDTNLALLQLVLTVNLLLSEPHDLQPSGADPPMACIALLLVVSPLEIPVPKNVPEPLWLALKKLAQNLEVVGPHERWQNNFSGELKYVRKHWRELEGTPTWFDCLHFPSACIASEYCSLNLVYQEYAKNRRWVCRHRYADFTDALQEARQLHYIWKNVQEATDMNNSWVHQRRALCKLRKLLGPEDYNAGRLPAPVPLWRFTLVELNP